MIAPLIGGFSFVEYLYFVVAVAAVVVAAVADN